MTNRLKVDVVNTTLRPVSAQLPYKNEQRIGVPSTGLSKLIKTTTTNCIYIFIIYIIYL